MKLNREPPWNSLLGGLVLSLGLMGLAPELRANVYATNVRVNGGTTNLVAAPGDTIIITYVLNEPAALGANVEIRSGSTVVVSLPLPADSQGTLRGPNTVTWDTTAQPVPTGTYTVAVVARTSGYTNWTQITSDTTDPNTYVFDGHGITVDRNPGSPYFGRIFVANSAQGFNPNTTPGDTLGILKFNADTSDAEEGISSADLDGHSWAGGDVSPWKLEVSANDYVHVDDLVNGGAVYRWDPTISSNSLLPVLRQDNRPAGAALSGPAMAGAGANTQIWMGDTNFARIFRWSVTSNLVCATNDTGIVVVSNTGPNLFDVALDPSGNIYTCAYTTTEGDPIPRVFRYAAYNPLTPNSPPETNADWAVGGGDDTYAGAAAVALDPTGTYLAVAFEGPITGGFNTNGNTKILWATNGALVANLDLGVSTLGDANHDDTDCAWDTVGNVYYIDNYLTRWRVVSPPGTNQATTVALATIQVGGSTPPPPSTTLQIRAITVTGGNVNIDFSADTNATASTFSVFGAATVNGTYAKIAGAAIIQVGSGLFHATFPLSPTTQYFRIVGQGTGQPPTSLSFTQVAVSGANLVLTFIGNSSDTTGAFALFGAVTVNGTYTQVASPNIVQISPGIFQATVPISGATHFYRIRR